MAMTPSELRYTKDHEWLRIAGDRATIGVTDHAQRQLGQVVFVELPKAGDRFEASDPFGSVESVKAVSEVYMPVTGTVVEVNGGLIEDPEGINDDPYGEGWMITIQIANPAEVNGLLTAAQYDDYIKEEAEG
jgi:glycine cleavage system H protein